MGTEIDSAIGSNYISCLSDLHVHVLHSFTKKLRWHLPGLCTLHCQCVSLRLYGECSNWIEHASSWKLDVI
jgi:hypothetical protein